MQMLAAGIAGITHVSEELAPGDLLVQTDTDGVHMCIHGVSGAVGMLNDQAVSIAPVLLVVDRINSHHRTGFCCNNGVCMIFTQRFFPANIDAVVTSAPALRPVLSATGQ